MSLRRKVSLKFKEFQGFVNEYSENVSTGGMFIRTPSPQPVGTVFDFEFTLGDDFTLIHGIGEVAWTREADEGFDRPAGMGIRFLNLDPDSRKLIDRMVQERLDRESRQTQPPVESERPWGDLSPPAAAWDDDAGSAAPADDGAGRAPLLFPSDLSGPADADEPFPRRSGPSPYVYARSYRGSGVARKTRKTRPLLVVLLAIAVVVAALAAFFLFLPETAVRLLVPGDSGDDRLVEVRSPAPETEAPTGEPVEPVAPSEAAGEPVEAPLAAAGDSATAGDEGGEEPELGFFEASPERTGGDESTAPPADRTPAPAPVPPPVPAPAPVPPPPAPAPGQEAAAPSAGFSRVLNVVWEQRGAEVLVTVYLDGAIQEWDYSTVRLDAPPREVVRIDGIAHPFPRTEIPVGNRLLDRIRIGYHPEGRTRQLHVVLDLASPEIEIDRTEAAGSELRIYLARGDGDSDGA